MSLFASIAGKAASIPFQIDKMSLERENVLTQVPPGDLADKDLKPEKDADNGQHDNNDHLVFMIRDSGDRISAKSVSPDEVTAEGRG